MNWYHRGEGRYVEYGTSFRASQAFGFKRSLTDTIYNMNSEHLSRDTPTVFETLDDAGVRTAGTTYLMYRGRHRHEMAAETALTRIASTVFRQGVYGPREFFYADLFASRRTGCRSQLGLPGIRDQHSGCVGAYLVEHDLFDFLLLSLPDNDTHSHRHGPDAQVTSLAAADRQIERVMRAAGGVDAFLEDHAVIVCSDHSQSQVDDEIDLFAAFADFAVLPAGGRARGRRGDRPVPELALRAGLRARPRRAARRSIPRVERVLLEQRGRRPRDADDRPSRRRGRRAERGRRAALRAARRPRRPARRRRGASRATSPCSALEEADGRLDSRRYPDALGRVWSALRCRTAGEVLASAKPGYEFLDWGRAHHVGGGSHGSLHAVDSFGSLLWCGTGPDSAAAREQWTLRDIVAARARPLRSGGVSAPPRGRGRAPPRRAARARAGRRPRAQEGGDGRARAAPCGSREVLDRPPPGWDAQRAGGRAPRRRAVRRCGRRAAAHPGSYARAYLRERRRWQVSFYARRARGDRRRWCVDDRSGRVLETWTGFRVAWPMARGTAGPVRPGGRTRPGSGSPLCALFALPFLRPPWRLLHADLAVLLAFSVSYAFFARRERRGLGAHGAAAARVAARPAAVGRPGTARARRCACCCPPARCSGCSPSSSPSASRSTWSNGNVIDVGYAGVVGADRLLDGAPLWGAFPPDIPRGDTYGPALYLAYAPFELGGRGAGRWDDLPAAHAASVAFDLACLGGLWLAGRRLGGPLLGLLLAYLWAAYPFTLLVSNSGSSDALVGADGARPRCSLLGRPAARGAAVAVAGPDQVRAAGARAAVRRLRPQPARGGAHRRSGGAAAAAVLLVPAATRPGGLALFWERTLGFQADREIALLALGPVRRARVAAGARRPRGAARSPSSSRSVPRRRDARTVAALGAAVLIAVQLALDHWFYLYLAWFLPLALIALVPPLAQAAGRSSGSIASARRRPAQRMSTALIHGSSSDGS